MVPFNSFSEFNKAEGGDIWFALDDTRPLACFAGIWTNWTSVRKVKEGETTNDLFAFLTTEPNAEVGAIHPKAMPVILTTPDEVETWMTASSGRGAEAAAAASGRVAPDRCARREGRSGGGSLGRLLRPRQRRDLALADDVARGAALDHAAGAVVSLATASKSIQFTPQRWPSRSSKLRPYMKS